MSLRKFWSSIWMKNKNTYMILKLVLQLSDMSFALAFRIAHLGIETIASSSDESRTKLILLAWNFLDLAEFCGEWSKLVSFQRESSLLRSFELLLDRSLLNTDCFWLRWRCSLGPRWLSQNHLVAQATLGLLLASDLRSYRNSNENGLADRNCKLNNH